MIPNVKAIGPIFAIIWAAFWLYWLVAAFSMKRGRIPWARVVRVRIATVILVIFLVRLHAFRSSHTNTNPPRAAIGLALLVIGLGFAVWARLHIGRNWGTPMTQKLEPELVTSGPYRLVRHPIYSGILLAGVGTAIALTWVWLIIVVITGAYFIYSATVEERFMTSQFPEAYPAYRRTSRMLIPYVF